MLWLLYNKKVALIVHKMVKFSKFARIFVLILVKNALNKFGFLLFNNFGNISLITSNPWIIFVWKEYFGRRLFIVHNICFRNIFFLSIHLKWNMSKGLVVAHFFEKLAIRDSQHRSVVTEPLEEVRDVVVTIAVFAVSVCQISLIPLVHWL